MMLIALRKEVRPSRSHPHARSRRTRSLRLRATSRWFGPNTFSQMRRERAQSGLASRCGYKEKPSYN